MTPYQKKLMDPRWQRRRLEKLDRAGWACECCGATAETLHVHHPRYVWGREPWEYADDELQSACETCHGEWTAAGKAWKSVVATNHEKYGEVAGLVGGYLDNDDIGDSGCGQARLVGLIARKLYDGDYTQLRAVAVGLGLLEASR